MRDDAGVQRVSAMKRSEGWSSRHHPGEYDLVIHVAPDGHEYVAAYDFERATLIREFDNGLPPLRLTDLDTSSRARRAAISAAERAAEVQTGEELIEVRKEKGRQIRAARVKKTPEVV